MGSAFALILFRNSIVNNNWLTINTYQYPYIHYTLQKLKNYLDFDLIIHYYSYRAEVHSV